MNTTSRSVQAPSTRLKLGEAVLARAEVVDTALVAAKLSAFTEAYGVYVDAERRVDEVEARLEAERLKLAQLGAEHDDAIEKLAGSLAHDGQPRANPFDSFGADPPSAIKRLSPAEAARAVRALLADVGRSSDVSAATREAGERLERVTQQVEAALGPVQTIQQELRATREMCDVVGRRFDRAASALRRAARAAGDDGAPDLYPALFPPTVRSSRKAKPTPAPTVTQPQALAAPQA